MRLLTDHKVNTGNDLIRIEVLDEPGPGGANHQYAIYWPSENEKDDYINLLTFQNGPINEAGVGLNGITHEALLAILADRLRAFQAGPYKCDENARALHAIGLAQQALLDRTMGRVARGVEGTHKI